MPEIPSTIIDNRPLGKGYGLLTFRQPAMAKRLMPGQFVSVRCTAGGFDPLLRRPFSPAGVKPDQGEIEILYRVLGRGTRFLCRRRKREPLDVIGPLGKGFRLLPDSRRIAVVGRGVGIAPLVLLSQQATNQGIAVEAFLSVRAAERGFADELEKRFRAQGATVHLSLDADELVTDRLREAFASSAPRCDTIYVCGSKRLLKETQDISRKYGVPSQVSLEERMACGIGVCHGCVAKIGSRASWHYAELCVEGPVFDAQEVILDD